MWYCMELERLKINNEFIAISLYFFINSMWFECCANYFVCRPHIEIPTNNPTFGCYPETKIETARRQWYTKKEQYPKGNIDIVAMKFRVHLLTLFYSWVFCLLFRFYTIFFGLSCVKHSSIPIHGSICIQLFAFQFGNCVWCSKYSRRVKSEVWTLPFAQMRYDFNLKFERNEHLLYRIISGCKENWSTSTAHCTSRHRVVQINMDQATKSYNKDHVFYEAHEYLMQINATFFCTKKKNVCIAHQSDQLIEFMRIIIPVGNGSTTLN